MYLYLCIILTTLEHTTLSDNTCDAPDQMSTLLPGSATAWAEVYDKLCEKAEEVKAVLGREGLGKVVGRLARQASLPGTDKQWREKFEDFNKENVLGAWQDMITLIKNGG